MTIVGAGGEPFRGPHEFFSKRIQTTTNQHIMIANVIPNNFKANARLKLQFKKNYFP